MKGIFQGKPHAAPNVVLDGWMLTSERGHELQFMGIRPFHIGNALSHLGVPKVTKVKIVRDSLARYEFTKSYQQDLEFSVAKGIS